MPMPAEVWTRRAHRFAFLGNSLLSPMTPDAAFGLDVLRGGIASNRQVKGQRADVLRRFRNEAHADGVNAAGAELHCPADAGLDFGVNQSGFLKLAHVQRSRGNRHVQRVGDFVDVHRTRGQQGQHPDAQRGGESLGDRTKTFDFV